MIKVYLDDERDEPDGWVRCYWPDAVINLLETNMVSEVSLDHDLGDDDQGTGYDVIKWIEEKVYTENFTPPVIIIHTANPAARIKMQAGVDSINKYRNNSNVKHEERLNP